jgi:hypothetical protein
MSAGAEHAQTQQSGSQRQAFRLHRRSSVHIAHGQAPRLVPLLLVSIVKACALPHRPKENRLNSIRRRTNHMADHRKTHNGRDVDGRFRVRQADVDDVLEDPAGPEVLEDDVRLGGAVADVGPQAGLHARHLGELIAENRDDVRKVTGRSSTRRSGPRPAARGKRGRKG